MDVKKRRDEKYGKFTVVTGESSGIGMAIVKMLAKRGKNLLQLQEEQKD